MTTLFDGGACNLNGITQQERLYVADVLQQVYVAVAEKGTEAAAATAVIIRDQSIDLPPPITVTFNRPWVGIFSGAEVRVSLFGCPPSRFARAFGGFDRVSSA
jgi:serpin B